MIRIETVHEMEGWRITPMDEDDIRFNNLSLLITSEMPSKQMARVVRGGLDELKNALPPLLYERYCLLRLSPSYEAVRGVGKAIRFSNHSELVFICEEE
jgi:hypothetical protein